MYVLLYIDKQLKERDELILRKVGIYSDLADQMSVLAPALLGLKFSVSTYKRTEIG